MSGICFGSPSSWATLIWGQSLNYLLCPARRSQIRLDWLTWGTVNEGSQVRLSELVPERNEWGPSNACPRLLTTGNSLTRLDWDWTYWRWSETRLSLARIEPAPRLAGARVPHHSIGFTAEGLQRFVGATEILLSKLAQAFSGNPLPCSVNYLIAFKFDVVPKSCNLERGARAVWWIG